MTYHQFCGNFLESKASVISRYTNYSPGESVLALLRGDYKARKHGGVPGGGDSVCNLPRLNQA
jgi:hypothetical protein